MLGLGSLFAAAQGCGKEACSLAYFFFFQAQLRLASDGMGLMTRWSSWV